MESSKPLVRPSVSDLCVSCCQDRSGLLQAAEGGDPSDLYHSSHIDISSHYGSVPFSVAAASTLALFKLNGTEPV